VVLKEIQFLKLSNALERRNKLDDMTISLNGNYIFDNSNEVEAGVVFKLIETKLLMENNVGARTDLNGSSANFSLFAKYKFLQFENFGLDFGTRVNLTGLARKTDPFTFEPRVSFSYQPIAGLTLKGAWGIYFQELFTVTDESEIISLFDPWIIAPDYFEPSKAIHYTGGAFIDFADNFSFSVETYLKLVKNLALINDNKVLSTDPDLLEGTSESYGFEFQSKYSHQFFSLSASYSLSWVYNELDEWVYHPKFDTRHILNLSMETRLGKGWTASVTWSYNSGLPFTQLFGYYDKVYLNDFYSNGLLNTTENVYAILADKNLARLPDYHRLDLSVNYNFVIFFAKCRMDLSVINLYDRENIFYFKRDTGEKVNMLPLLPSISLKVEI
jgi:outer membrane receptor protein involved in Fe transport